MAVKFADMDEKERREKFEAWVNGREEKTVKNKVKNKARKVVIDANKAEYDALVKKAAATIKAVPLTKEEEAKVLANAVEKKIKSKSRAQARKSILTAHKDQYEKALAAAEKA